MLILMKGQRYLFIFFFIILTKGIFNPSRYKTQSDMTRSCRFKFDFCVCFIFAFENVTNAFQKNTHWIPIHLVTLPSMTIFQALGVKIYINCQWQSTLMSSTSQTSWPPHQETVSARGATSYLCVCLFVCPLNIHERICITAVPARLRTRDLINYNYVRTEGSCDMKYA